MKVCTFEGCKKVLRAKGLCSSHYNMMRKGEGIRPIPKFTPEELAGRVCSIPSCGRKYRAKGYCQTHYNQHKEHGEITSIVIGKKKPTTYSYLCSQEECHKTRWRNKYCYIHYHQVILNVPPKPRGRPSQKNNTPCEVMSCDRMAAVKGMCSKHYSRFKRHGDTGVNYHRKYRSKNIIPLDNVLRPHMAGYTTADEREIITEMFGEVESEGAFY